MCGIAGLLLKNEDLQPLLGKLMVPMLDHLTSRGPDSAGIAIYDRDLEPGELKYSLSAPAELDWDSLEPPLAEELGTEVRLERRGRQAVCVTTASNDEMKHALGNVAPGVRLFGYGRALELYKDVGSPLEVCGAYGIANRSGYAAIGHTRMATESAVTTEHSHPFAGGCDISLVHNGSFSNYASIRRDLAAEGVECDTDNDSEVAARYIAREMAGGGDLKDALYGVMRTFDGFFTLLVAAEDSIAVVRDASACKPLVVAETPEYVAVASEYVALTDLPGIEEARVFEPQPEEIFTW
jgi:glutamate synthase domain-containing protein 1